MKKVDKNNYLLTTNPGTLCVTMDSDSIGDIPTSKGNIVSETDNVFKDLNIKQEACSDPPAEQIGATLKIENYLSPLAETIGPTDGGESSRSSFVNDMEKDSILKTLVENIQLEIKQEIEASENEARLGVISDVFPVIDDSQETSLLGDSTDKIEHSIKEEYIIDTNKDAFAISGDVFEKSQYNKHSEDVSKILSHNDVKNEICGEDNSLVSYDFPQFDSTSMDGSERNAFEYDSCLDAKADAIDSFFKRQKDSIECLNVKQEPDLTVTETHLISNKLINTTTSTITRPQDGIIESQTTRTLVMEILPMSMSTHNVPLSKITNNPEQILSTNDDNYDNSFQLNSITGDILPLEAYGLLDKTKHSEKAFKSFFCNRCPKECTSAASLKSHLKVHDSIERYAMGRAKGLLTRKKNLMKKKLKESEQTDDDTEEILPDKTECEKKDDSRKPKGRPRMFSCPICQKKSFNYSNFKLHIKVHDSIERFALGLTSSKVKRKDLVRKRKVKLKNQEEKEEKPRKTSVESVTETAKEIYKCTCGKKFSRRTRMETCLRSHNEFSSETTYSCITCSKQFENKEDLAMHRKRLHRKKKFHCKFCPADYNSHKKLFKHLRKHQKAQLMEYKVISEVAEGKEKLKCFMCSKSFTEMTELKTHVLGEHKEPYVCPNCKESFTKIVDFATHVKTVHPKFKGQSLLEALEAFSKLAQAWKCEECNLQFNQADELALHQVEKHKHEVKVNESEQIQCPDCRRVFASAKSLNSHRRVHHNADSVDEQTTEQGLLCVYCRKICKDENALTSHMRFHSPERKYPCKYCDFRFATVEKRKTHAEIHTGNMRYVCFICEYRCSSENRLNNHKMSVKHLSMKDFLLTGKPLESDTQKEEGVSKKSDETENDVSKKRRISEESDNTTPGDTNKTCDVCGMKFHSEKKMLAHKLTHPFIEFPNEDQPSRIFFK